MKRHFIVTVDVPEGVTITEMAGYIHGAVRVEAGSLNPDEDPLFYLDRESINVQHATAKRLGRLLRVTR